MLNNYCNGKLKNVWGLFGQNMISNECRGNRIFYAVISSNFGTGEEPYSHPECFDESADRFGAGVVAESMIYFWSQGNYDGVLYYGVNEESIGWAKVLFTPEAVVGAEKQKEHRGKILSDLTTLFVDKDKFLGMLLNGL